MRKAVARLRELRNQLMGIDQESIDNNRNVYGRKYLISRHIMTVISNINAILIELNEAINVYDNRWEAIVEDNERWEELMGNYEKRLDCWRQLGNDRLLRIEELVERKAELLSEIEMKDEIIRQYRDNLDRFSETIDEKNTKIDSMRRKSAEQSRRIAELTRGV